MMNIIIIKITSLPDVSNCCDIIILDVDGIPPTGVKEWQRELVLVNKPPVFSHCFPPSRSGRWWAAPHSGGGRGWGCSVRGPGRGAAGLLQTAQAQATCG